MLMILPTLSGFSAALYWPNASDEYYTTVAQIIATLFIAIAIELFARERPMWEDPLEQGLVLVLIVLSWSGLFGSIRALLGESGSLTSGLAAAGLMSSSILVSLALHVRLAMHNPRASVLMLFVFVAPPVLLLARP